MSGSISKRSNVTLAIALPCVEWLHSTVSTDAHDAVANLFDLGCSGFAPQFIGGCAAIVVIDSLGIGVLPELQHVQVHRLMARLLKQEITHNAEDVGTGNLFAEESSIQQIGRASGRERGCRYE